MLKQFQSLVFSNILILCASAVLWTIPTTASHQVTRPRGIPLSRLSLYDPEKDFTCLDGSATFPFKYVNDDYCDCKDGSDEPGTSACPNGSFYCKNLGHEPSIVPSSRVNDGICDCCDGADEFEFGTNCANTCREMGAAAREENQRRFELESQGYAAKLQYINQGKQAKVGQEERAQALKAEQVEAEALRAEKEREKKEAEEPEKLALEKYQDKEVHEEEVKEPEEDPERVKREAEATQAFEWLDSNQDGKVQVTELQTQTIFDQNNDGTVSVDEAKFFLHLEEEIDKETFIRSAWPMMKPFIMKQQEIAAKSAEIEQPAQQEEPSPDAEGEVEEEDDDREDDTEIVKPSPVAPSNVEYDAETQALIDAAAKARDAYDEADRRVRDIEREIRQLEEGSSKDFGPEQEFQPLDGQCFEYTDREYTYKLCPYDNASQRPKHGGSETRLGSWGTWDGPSGNKYSAMKYDRGVQCWNGPARSVKVHLFCGMDNVVQSVSEPNRCEYEMKFTTPAVCKEPQKPNEGIDQHDEL